MAVAINDFVRKHMDCRFFKVKEMPVFVYNTWAPFKHNINEKKVRAGGGRNFYIHCLAEPYSLEFATNDIGSSVTCRRTQSPTKSCRVI